MTCKDCVHYEVCYLIEHYGADENDIENCKHFKNKADFVEVVHCKDCKHFMEYTDEYAQVVEGAKGDCYIRKMNTYYNERFCGVQPDDYCNYGERKDNNGN